MIADVVALPLALKSQELAGQTCVVLDILRATTSITVALASGAKEIRVFADIGAARREANGQPEQPLLCGEENCLRPAGFDLGNSPSAFNCVVAHRTLYMATTNGTRALLAAEGARLVLVGALVNARAVARTVREAGADLTLLCAGTGGKIAMEDLIGAGAVLSELQKQTSVEPASDVARMAVRIFMACRDNLFDALADAQGGRNLIQAGLAEDIEFAARLHSMDVVGAVYARPSRICALHGPLAAIIGGTVG